MGDTLVDVGGGNDNERTGVWEDAEAEEIEVEFRHGFTREMNGGPPAVAHCTRDGAELKMDVRWEDDEYVVLFECSVCRRRARVAF